MLTSFYAHQYRCLQNFEIELADLNSALLLGRNGSGKSSVFDALQLFQQIGRGEAQLKDLVDEADFAFGETHKPIAFELKAALDKENYAYKLTIELPKNFSQPRVQHESLSCEGQTLFIREGGQTTLYDTAEFTLDWHHVGLPLISTRHQADPIAKFRDWLAAMIVIVPIPQLFETPGKQGDTYLRRDASNLLSWSNYHIAKNPALYERVVSFLQARMPDLEAFRFDSAGKREWDLLFSFSGEKRETIEFDLSQLSDGEKIYYLAALVITLVGSRHGMLCIWDEPDNYISLQELEHFITVFRKTFENSPVASQLLVSSHNAKTINAFSSHNTFTLSKASHLEPARLRKVATQTYDSPTLVDAYENGELG